MQGSAGSEWMRRCEGMVSIPADGVLLKFSRDM